MSSPHPSRIPQQKVPWNKLLAVALLVLLVGYIVARPTLERWWGIQLPALVEGPDSAVNDARPNRDAELAPESSAQTRPQESGNREPSTGTARSTQPKAAQQSATPGGTAGPAESASESSSPEKDPFRVPPRAAGKGNNAAESTRKWELKPIDRGRLLSPAGLIYARGPQGEHRVEHVMRHAEDDPNRPQHGVFNGSREEILQLIDEAYQLIQQNSKRVNKQVEGDRAEYTIRFDRPIGYEGGRSGKRNSYPQVNRLRLVLEDGKSVITAYPVR